MNCITNYFYKSNNDLLNIKCYYCKQFIPKNNDIFMYDDKQFCSHNHRKNYLNYKYEKKNNILKKPSSQNMITIFD